MTLASLLNAEPVYRYLQTKLYCTVLHCAVCRWYPETKQDKAKQYYDAAVELFKAARYLDSFHLFQRAYRLAVLGEGIQN